MCVRVNANPMRDRAAGRAKPMTATATRMVKAIWASYFTPVGAAAPEGAEAAGVHSLTWPCSTGGQITSTTVLAAGWPCSPLALQLHAVVCAHAW